MPHYAFIDESGTMDHQDVMTVAAIVFEGEHSIVKLHDHVMRDLNPRYAQLQKQLKKDRKGSKLPRLHFTDMTNEHRATVGKRLANAKVSVFAASYWYETPSMSHEARFGIYTELVKLSIRKAFEMHKELEVGVAKQGGWQGYKRRFLMELKQIPGDFTKNGDYRKGEFYLLSAAKAGIQIADFYVGAVRDHHRGLTGAHDYIKHQVVCCETYRMPIKAKEGCNSNVSPLPNVLCLLCRLFPITGGLANTATRRAKAYDTRFVSPS